MEKKTFLITAAVASLVAGGLIAHNSARADGSTATKPAAGGGKDGCGGKSGCGSKTVKKAKKNGTKPAVAPAAAAPAAAGPATEAPAKQ